MIKLLAKETFETVRKGITYHKQMTLIYYSDFQIHFADSKWTKYTLKYFWIMKQTLRRHKYAYRKKRFTVSVSCFDLCETVIHLSLVFIDCLTTISL